jgi:Cytochrome C and Quinol oxidase polypeptide I
VGIFDPALGGDPVLFQHLFWFYSHPAVYIMILPAMGVTSELIANFSRKNIWLLFVAFSSLAIAVFGFLVWGHHLFVSSQSVYAGMIFSFLSFAVAIPSAIKVFNWTATLYKSSISYHTPMLPPVEEAIAAAERAEICLVPVVFVLYFAPSACLSEPERHARLTLLKTIGLETNSFRYNFPFVRQVSRDRAATLLGYSFSFISLSADSDLGPQRSVPL